MERATAGVKYAAATARYRVREFADLGGVTIKALQHYDRLNLLRPARTSAGHRTYSPRDRERLRQILALKRAGVPLTRIRKLLDADSDALATFLRERREEIAREQAALAHVDQVLALVEENLTYAPDDRPGLSLLADVADTSREAAAMARYFSEDAWPVARGVYENWPDPHWVPLYRDIVAAARQRPDSGRASELLQRWNMLGQSLWRGLTSDAGLSRALHDGFARAWRDREHWPETLKRRFADYHLDEVAAFLRDTSYMTTRQSAPSAKSVGAA